MISIPVTDTLFAQIDEADLLLVSRYTWHAHKDYKTHYAHACTSRKRGAIRTRLAMHRLILGAKAGQIVDHIDGNGLNNTRTNLRLCTASQNRANSRNCYGANEYQGVYQHPKTGRWYAQIWINNRSVKLGVFRNQFSAVFAYDAAARKRWGEFAKPNFAPLPDIWRVK